MNKQKQSDKYRLRFRCILIVLLFGVLISFIFTLCFGAMKINPINTYQILVEKAFGLKLSENNLIPLSEYNIIWKIRLPRVILAAIVGAGLALCGAVMQATVQNPLAEPYILGISSGASLGATFSIFLGIGISITFGAFMGSVLATMAVLSLAAYGSKITSSKLVLSGTVVNALFGAFSNFIISVSGNAESTMTIKFWTMGSLTKANQDNIWLPIIVVAACSIFFMTQYRTLNTMLAGDEAAVTLGINLNFYRKLYMVMCALLTGVLVSSCGIIGFVGLIVPHIIRALVGAEHRRLIPVALLTGAIFMMWADVFARSLVRNAELPIGIITALVGAPFFVYILIKQGYSFGAN